MSTTTIEVPQAFGWVLLMAVAHAFELFVFGGVVGSYRKKHNVKYPDVTGPEEFNRAMRVHYNALEGAPFFFVTLLICGFYWAELAALAGFIYIVGRAIYCVGYLKSVEGRITGGIICHLAELMLLIGSIVFIFKMIV